MEQNNQQGQTNDLTINTTFSDIRKMYSESRSFQNIGIFLMGLYGSGKTQFICTGRKPILIDTLRS